MNPEEDLPGGGPAAGLLREPVWKRIFVILAGPAVNVSIAFVILFGVAFVGRGARRARGRASRQRLAAPTAAPAGRRDRLGRRRRPPTTRSSPTRRLPTRRWWASTSAPGEQTDGCRAADAGAIVVERDGARGAAEDHARTTTTRSTAPAWDSPSTPEAPSRSTRPCPQAAGDSRRPDVARHLGDRSRPSPSCSRRRSARSSGAWSARSRRPARRSSSTLMTALQRDRARLALAGADQPLPVPSARRRARLLEPRREGPRASAFRCARWSRRASIGFALIMVIFVIGFTNDIDRFSNGGFDLR